jgi:3-oxoacyl-[acyl-carrier-protein] synthase-3
MPRARSCSRIACRIIFDSDTGAPALRLIHAQGINIRYRCAQPAAVAHVCLAPPGPAAHAAPSFPRETSMPPAVPPIPLRILGTGEHVPSRRVESAEFDKRWGKPEGWTRKHVGIDYRHYAGPGETASLMGAQAATAALARAGLRAQDLDCVVSACSVMEQAIPSTGVLVQRRLGLESSRVPAFDVNATCLSFVTALDLVASAIAIGRYRRVLIVSSEVASAGLNQEDPDTAPLFGDGAAAVVVAAAAPGEDSALLGAHMETFSEGAELCQVRAGGTRLRLADLDAFRDGSRFEMQGKPTYRLAAKVLPGYFERLFARAGIEASDLTRLVPHQASVKALKNLEDLLHLPPGAIVRVLATRGNQMAASIPIALHHAITTGQIVRGDLVALVGSSAGLSLGGAVLRY